MTELILIRHGETDWNVEKRLQGHHDITLNAEGERQAQALARRLKDEPIDAIYSSDLQRAYLTAQAIAEVRGMPILAEEGLRERCFGAFEGSLHPELAQRYPDDYAALQRRDVDARYPRGEFECETLTEFNRRTLDCVARIAAAGHRRVLVVTHGGVLDCVYRRATGMALNLPRSFDVLNASLNHVQWDGEQATILKWADVAHLGSRAEGALDEIDARHKIFPA
ncbi:histidine phosphatase family protein [uncultured Oxalicibacterium sp.]|uniref:histidine phosphatase family protein n=1 Tax=uncultured Oxalicibacterium sp. TaxID=1168540 RepID=UPI0025D0E232|nr:histidine phosphatase family protein [uncultured Oxalicibacterium sp.]